MVLHPNLKSSEEPFRCYGIALEKLEVDAHANVKLRSKIFNFTMRFRFPAFGGHILALSGLYNLLQSSIP